MVELLMPAGNLKKLKTALYFGADAVYIGGKDFSLRAFADNFSREDIISAVEYAHALHKKVYVTVNIFARNTDLDKVLDYFLFLESAGCDAVIVSDIGLVSLCLNNCPSLPVHLSTQANTTNKFSLDFYHSLGVERVVLARELSLDEIAECHNHCSDVELECFVHGAMCMSYSGRCLLSSYFSNRSSNKGECIQPCRWSYTVTETERHNAKPIEIEEDSKGTYFMNSKDLRLMHDLPAMISAGVTSFKVEGRMKSEFYVATVANAYRKAIDECLEFGEIKSLDRLMCEVEKVAHRAYTDAFFDGDNNNTFCYENGQLPETHEFIAVVLDYADGVATVEMRNRFKTGNVVEIVSPHSFDQKFEIGQIWDNKGQPTDDARLVQHHYKIATPIALSAGDILRKELPYTKQTKR